MAFIDNGGLAIAEEDVSKLSFATPLMKNFRLLSGLELPKMDAY